MSFLKLLALSLSCLITISSATSFDDIREKANQGIAEAQVNLGLMYYKEEGVLKDDKKSVYWYNKAAKQGNAAAQTQLGTMYETGIRGVLQDYKKAVYWYNKAANQGYAKAQYNLGVMYARGRGVLQDYKKAVYWYNKAANQGYAAALHVLRQLRQTELIENLLLANEK